MNWQRMHAARFRASRSGAISALELGREVARAGGTAGAVLNAANEAAVAGFLRGNCRF